VRYIRPVTRSLSAALLLVVALLFAGCRRTPGPVDRYRTFAAAARSGDAGAVWSMLSTRTQAAFDARAKALAAEAPGVVPARGQDLVVGDLASRAPKVRSAVVLRESAEAAVIAVEDEAGARAEVTLVREGGDWEIDVPAAGG
jgi:hypothetical protein